MIYAPVSSLTSDADRVRRGCSRFLSGHYPLSPKDTLRELSELVDADAEADMYGSGLVIEELEARVATLLGMDAAVFMPSGTMCQQIAMRLWTERRGVQAVAMHPRNHLDRPEHHGYTRLHGIQGVPVGGLDRLIALEDLQATREPVGALLLELPQREIGGMLPSWDELEAQCAWARERGVPVHMDGARLWQCELHFGRSYAEIAGLFDSVYVSFYKDLGGIAGAALAGPEDFVAEARLWMRRHGGNVIRLYPYVLSAQQGLDRHLPRMGEYHAKAVQLAGALGTVAGIDVVPDPPQANMMHIHLRADSERLISAVLDVSEESGVWLGSRLAATPLPAVQRMELTAGEATIDISIDEIRELFSACLERAGI